MGSIKDENEKKIMKTAKRKNKGAPVFAVAKTNRKVRRKPKRKWHSGKIKMETQLKKEKK